MVMHGRLSSLWDAAYGNLKKKWTLDEMAKMVCLSPAHFSRICKEHYKMSPFQMLTKLRMQRAEELLKTSNMKLTAIADSVGYDNSFAFSTAFKRFCGVSPKEFKRKSTTEKS
jgi:transcriptional regulator GlxA family with amidase domain